MTAFFFGFRLSALLIVPYIVTNEPLKFPPLVLGDKSSLLVESSLYSAALFAQQELCPYYRFPANKRFPHFAFMVTSRQGFCRFFPFCLLPGCLLIDPFCSSSPLLSVHHLTRDPSDLSSMFCPLNSFDSPLL